MKIEMYELGKTPNITYQSLGTMESDATPVSGGFIYYGTSYYKIDYVVISVNRIVAFVSLNKKSSEMGFEGVF